VLFRFVWPWRVFSAIPTTVVERSAQRIVLWIAEGTPVRWPRGQRLPIPELRRGEWNWVEAEWYGGRLMIWERGAAHSVYVQWGREGEFLGWYVNLEEPWRETRLGLDTTDYLLDVWVDPDRSWRWKDEDHLAEAVEIGLFTPEKAEAIRAEGERAMERIEAWGPPFDEGWESWRPDPSWLPPHLPNDWEILAGASPPAQ
jgi:hypothetical protein